ncbi:MAG: DNA adenine methylase [Muribaculaceae bacterium]
MQLCFFDDIETNAKFPTTRYQGSKLKFVDWIWDCIKDLHFTSVLDGFGGTGSVAYRMKKEGKSITYNDILTFNSIIGKALIENSYEQLEDYEAEALMIRHNDITYPSFIEDTFSQIYFTDEENRWLDVIVTNIAHMQNEYKQAIAWFALFQSCIIKRPYNLFHRKNLYLRMQEVDRTFGNKATWDTPFPKHFMNFIREANNAIFSNENENIALNKNIFDIKDKYDLVYIDTPYISEKGVGVNYFDFYHFLEGLVDYANWDQRIDNSSKHKRLKHQESEWNSSSSIEKSFEKLISKFQDSILVISYRSDGIPSIDRIKEILTKNSKKVTIFESREIKYVLSKKHSSEVLIIGE